MVVLWVVLEDLGLLSVLKIADEIVHSELLPPFFVGNKPIAPALSAYLLGREMQVLGTQCCWCENASHLLAQLDIEFPSPQEPEETQRV